MLIIYSALSSKSEWFRKITPQKVNVVTSLGTRTRNYPVGIVEEVMNWIRMISVDNDYNHSVGNTQRQRKGVI